MIRTQKYNICTAVISGVMAVIFQIVFCFAVTLVQQMALVVAFALLGLVPYVLNLKTIRNYCIDKVSRFVLYDLLFVLLPVAVMSLISEAIVLPFTEVRTTDGIGSLIIIAIVLLEAVVFWGAYYITNKIS